MPAVCETPPEKPFILYVGPRRGYKNFKQFARAFASSNMMRRNFELICFGGEPLGDEDVAAVAVTDGPSVSLRRLTGDDAVLGRCYRQASLFVCPSLSEGFGVPVLEAMSAGCPVACAKVGSLPEVGGGAAIYFDPTSIDDMRGAMESVLDSDERRKTMSVAGIAWAKTFSWERCAADTRAVYERLLAGNA
jgi:glycosyltransferase involved in cell wall biosynthesis